MDLPHFDNLCFTINHMLINLIGHAEARKHGVVEEFYFQRQRGMLEAIREHNDRVVETVRKAQEEAARSPEHRYEWQCPCGMNNEITAGICMGCGHAAPVLGKKGNLQ